MELKQLRYFVGVSEAGSLLKASTRLHIAQPALGQQIAALEVELGVRLFDRSSRGVALTEAGRLFLEHARIVLADAERAKLAVRQLSSEPQGDVSLGLPTTIALAATVPLVRACRAQFPKVRLKLTEAYSGYLREWLQSGRLDIALVYGGGSELGLNQRALFDDRLVFVTSPDNTHIPDQLSVHDLAQWPLVLPGHEHGLRRMIDEACKPHQLRLNVVAEIESLGSVKRAAESGLGSTILPLGTVAEEVEAGRLRIASIDSPNMYRRVVCATNATRPQTLAVSAVITLLYHVLREMASSRAWPVRWVGN